MNTGTVYILVGVILLAGGTLLFFDQRARIRRAIRTEGEVIELIQRRVRGEFIRVKTPDGVKLEQKYIYRPLIRFRTQQGRRVKFSPSIAMRPAPYQVGDRVPVLYLPEDPHRAQIDRFVYLWFYVIMLNAFGLLSIGLGVLIRVLQ